MHPPRLNPPSLGLFLSLLLLFFVAPGLHWLDSSELTLAMFDHGISHPPGQVPYLLFGKPLQWLPIGSIAFRTNLFSWACTGASLYLVSLLARRQNSRWAALTGVFACVSPYVFVQAVRTEVYSFVGCLLLCTVYLSSLKDARAGYASCFIAGMAMASHPVMGLFGIPFVVKKEKWSLRILFFTLSAAVLLYLPIRAHSATAWNFGDPSNASRLIWFLRGDLYPAYGRIAWTDVFSHLGSLGASWIQAHSFIPVACMIVCFVLCAKEVVWSRPYLIGSALLIGCLVRQTNFWPKNPDVFGYLVPVVWGMIFLALVTLEKASERARVLKRLGVGVMVAWLLYGCFVQDFTFQSYARDTLASEHMKYLLSEPLGQKNVSASNFVTYSLMRYGQTVERRRPDLVVQYRGDARKTHRPQIEHSDYVETALAMNAEGQYTLKPEDKKLILSGHDCSAWFCSKWPQTHSGIYEGYVSRVYEDIKHRDGFSVESYVLHETLAVLRARVQKNSEAEGLHTDRLLFLLPEAYEYNNLAQFP